jgi:hypothetical protein
MKTFLILVFCTLLSVTLLYGQEDKNELPFKPNYSSKIQIGNPEHVKVVLNFWKDWDNNTMDKSNQNFDDSVMVLLSSGRFIQGKSNLISTRSATRDAIQSVKSTVDVWVPLHITDKNEWLVALWGSQNVIRKDGSKVTQLINEIWRINKDGKVDMIRQYTGMAPGSVKD